MKTKKRKARPKKLPGHDRSWMQAFGYGLVDPTERPFDEWVDLIFNHQVTDPEWYRLQESDPGWAGDPNRFLAYATQLFQNPNVLLDQYSAEQINQGFCYLLPEHGLWRWIWEEAIDTALRTECVMSMFNVFEQLFNSQTYKEAYFEACYMWWDYLRISEKNNPDPKVKEAILKALSKILEIDSRNCQRSALHGLGHLEHPEKEKVIEKFVLSHPDLDTELTSYAYSAMQGSVL